MNNLTLLLIRLAFLAVLWLFVIAAVGVVRTDLFGQARAHHTHRRDDEQPQDRQEGEPDQQQREVIHRVICPRMGPSTRFAFPNLSRQGVSMQRPGGTPAWSARV